MTCIILATIMAVSPFWGTRNAQIVVSQSTTTVEDARGAPKIRKLEKALDNFQRLLHKGKLTLPGITIEEPSSAARSAAQE